MKCRFDCNSPAVAVYILDRGCTCFPDDKIQALCAQHEYDATPINDMMLVTRWDCVDARRGVQKDAPE
jgi:hypothetical protein